MWGWVSLHTLGIAWRIPSCRKTLMFSVKITKYVHADYYS